MRSYQLPTFLVLCTTLFFAACQNIESPSEAAERARNPRAATVNTFPNAPGSPAAAAASATTPVSGAGGNQAHYVCPNGCAGGTGTAQGNCPVCGTAMNHNAAYHNPAAATTTDPEANAPIGAFNAVEPHYKCPNGCAGGGGPAKGNCPVCGTAMAHNTAYHNASANSTASTTIPEIDLNSSGANTTAGVFHYTCSNGCAGGADSAVACSTCGATLVHNTAYHSAGSSTTTPTLTPPGDVNLNTPTTSTTAAQNAAGLFHYTCSNGCAGGAASAVACSTCGATLVHNTAYHGN